jgi:hypothetical protein
MPRESDRVKVWTDRFITSNKLYEDWSEKFETKRLENYYLGFQWTGKTEEEAKKLYVINLVFSSIEVNKPTLSFYKPQVRVQPRPSRSDDLLSNAENRARLCQDTVQTFIDDPDLDFFLETNLALHEAHFRFGIIEVGYTADFVDNPDAGKPVLKEDKSVLVDSSGDPVLQGAHKLKKEGLFLRRIPADTFRVSVSSKNKISRNDWVGYYEWHYVEDIKRNTNYKNTAGLKQTGSLKTEIRTPTMDKDENEHHGMIKIWKVWDLRSQVRHVIASNHDKFLQEDVPFTYLPFAVIKFHEILDSFYPLPPTFEWLGPQDEVNETREMQRAHRRRFYRRYTYKDGAIDVEELEKLEAGGDGVYAKSNMDNPLIPVPDAPLSSDVWQHLDASKLDFMTVSAIGGDQRGVAESETATQANIIDQRSRIRESSARTRVANWLADIGRLMLLCLRDNMAMPFWIRRNVDPYAAKLGSPEPMRVSELFEQISSDDLDLDFDIFVDLASMSPVAEDVQRLSWNQVLAIITNPAILSLLGKSEVLLRKTLRLYGITAENEIQEIKRVMAETVMEMQMAAMMQAAGGEGGAGKPAGGPKNSSNGSAQKLTAGAAGGNGANRPGSPMAQALQSVGRTV